jgi:dienelactone hydrolase/ribosome-associated toxin RatA of RatAB toxin-antitoxin module/ubiquinone/menaquinone biosynthesis C-methylase UbiE
MQIIKLSTTVNADKHKVFELFRNIEEFPRFISGVENTVIRQSTPTKLIVDWRVNIDGTVVTWKEEDTFDKKNLLIKFKMLEGQCGTFHGEWSLSGNGKATKIDLLAYFDWGSGDLRECVDSTLYKRARFSFRWMLREIKRNINGTIRQGQELPGSSIISEVITYKNKHSKNIVGFFDHLRGNSKHNPFIVIPHQYGATKRDGLSIAYYLAKNGFNVIRYDCTNHIGESDGRILDTTLSGMRDDLLATLDWAEEQYGAHKFGVVAFCLGARVAIKAAAEDSRIKHLISVMGVVNLQDTLYSVYKEDMIGTCLSGRKWDVTDVLGFEVKGEFLENAIEYKFHDLAATLNDIQKIKVPIFFLIAEKDAWVRFEDINAVYEKLPNPKKEFQIIHEAVHMFRENPRIEKTVLRYIVADSLKHLCNKEVKPEAIHEPGVQAISKQNYAEKERLRSLVKVTADKERQFWNDYISGYSILHKSKDYRDYLSLMINLLGGLREGEKLLDAGSGNGNFGMWLLEYLINRFEKSSQKNLPKLLPKYVGLDFSEISLKDAQKGLGTIQSQFCQKNDFACKINCLMGVSLIAADLNKPIALKNNYFDKACCSLLLPFVNDPVFTTKELLRVLKPGKKLVVTSLKPHADLSEIYRNFLDLAKNKSEIMEARKMLSNSGRIKQKESVGYYHFFSESELVAIMVAAGAKHVRVFKSFANQANVVVCEKTKRG